MAKDRITTKTSTKLTCLLPDKRTKSSYKKLSTRLESTRLESTRLEKTRAGSERDFLLVTSSVAVASDGGHNNEHFRRMLWS